MLRTILDTVDAAATPATNLEQFAIEAVLTRSNQLVAVVDASMVVRWLSPSASFYGIEALNRSIVEYIHTEDLERAAQAFDPYVFEQEFVPSHMANSLVSLRLITPAGLVPFEASGRWIRESNGKKSWLVVVLNDISTRYGTNLALRQLAAGADPIDAAQAIVEAAHGFGGVVGAQMVHDDEASYFTVGDMGDDPSKIDELWPDLLLVDRPAPTTVPVGADWCFAFPLRAADERVGSMIVWGLGSDPDLEFARAVMEPMLDLAALSVIRSRQLAELNRQATTDHITGLLNRHAFFGVLASTVRDGAVIYIDLDSFKAVNDEFGHTLGDRLLGEISCRLKASAGPNDPVGRVGGDEFALAFPGVSADEARAIGDRISAALNQTLIIDGHEIDAGASIGIAFTESATNGIDLIDAADQALLKAKSEGKGRVVFVRS